ncbi:MAG: hypothetical protein KKE50_01215 [Nanoarchaeota archaeon]|nr:hypothetical protein [Nanoarchaeota archaeon]
MKKQNIIVISIILLAVIIIGAVYLLNSNPQNDSGIVNCNDNYNCLYQQIEQGNSAKVIIEEDINSLSLIEKSSIEIKPLGNNYEINMMVLDLKPINQNTGIKSIAGALSESCPQIANQLDKIEGKNAICVAKTIDEIKELVNIGLTEDSISKYSCSGNLINSIKEICVNDDFPHFPPGVKKPAIYLYPLMDSKIQVKVDVNGRITKDIPDYNNGWDVFVTKEGIIDNKYDYLFYEAELNKLNLPNEGWVVKYSDLENWFSNNLPKLGLNEKETNQFKEYWLNELPKSDYYEIKLLDDKFLKENMNLGISPTPDTLIRVEFYFKPTNSIKEINEPVIVTPIREGFTAVEWGGILDN